MEVENLTSGAFRAVDPLHKERENSNPKRKRRGGEEKKTVEKQQAGALIQDQTIKYDCEKHNNGGYKHCMNLWC